MTVRQSLFQYLDDSPEKLLSGWDIYDEIKAMTGRETYPTTLIKYCKEYADMSGADFICVDRQRSLYRYVPGYKIAGCLTGRE